MSLEFQPGRSGWFYARFQVRGRPVFRNLNVRIEGRPPRKLTEEGDAAFERSRARAQMAHDRLADELRSRTNTEELCQTILEVRTGKRLGSVPLEKLIERWLALERKRPLAGRWKKACIAQFERFCAFLVAEYPNVRELSEVDVGMARAFMRVEEARGVSGKTYNDTLKLFRSSFKNLSREAGIAENPFAGISTKDADTIHRHPFSEEELDAIIEASKSDPQAHDLIVTAACTAMRLGDVARLRWEDVDLEENFIDVKTSKTGETATIPIFARLRSVLAARRVCGEGYVFPELEKQYSVAPDVLTKRVRKAMRAAGFGDPGIERGNGEPTRGAFHKRRKVGIRQASIRDIHSLRLTWVTIALNSGVPVNLVQKVTGHTTVEIVLKHYYRPGRQDLKQELEKRLPAALTGAPAKAIAAKDSLRDKLTSMTADNWQLVRDELLKGLGQR